MNTAKKILAAGLVAFTACNSPVSETNKKEDALAAHVDSSVNPADDFFAWVNGRWLKENPIPADEVSWGIGHLVDKELREKLFAINDAAVNTPDGTATGKLISDFWYSAMDSATIEREGINPLKPMLDQINNVKDHESLLACAMELHKAGVDVFFSGSVSQDAKNSEVEAYDLSQGGLGLPNRDYYFNTTARTAKILELYPGYITTVFRLMGNDEKQAAEKAKNIVVVETKLAAASRKLEDLRDPYLNYNKMAIASLRTLTPSIDWGKYLTQLGVTHVDSVIVGQPEFYKALDKVLTATDIATLKDYMAFHVVRTYGSYLSKPFVDANFEFYSKAIRGAQEQQPRRRLALATEQSLIGEALGQLFVKEYFSPTAKARYEQIVENVRQAYKARIEKLDWMSPETKERAIHKLMVVGKKVGYPDQWKDFSAMKIDRTSYAANVVHASEWWYNHEMDKLGKPVNRNEWDMTPQTYNAYYNESNNEIVLPAAMMAVPGFKDEELDDALVYGYMGASTVGHEITHGFDDQGRQFDEKGNLSAWWAPADTAKFNKRANVLVEQFNKMVPIDTLHINGRATLGENLADLGGILIGLDAFKQTEAYKSGKTIAGYTQLQRFFMGYALGWLMTQRPESLSERLLTDVHSPAKYRVNGPFPNVPEFYEAFGIKPGDKMYLADSARVNLW